MKFLVALSILVLSSLGVPTFGAETSLSENIYLLEEDKENNPQDYSIKVATKATFTRRPIERKPVEKAVPINSAEPNTIVFFLTAPHDQDDRGDTDYVQSVMRALKNKPTFFEVDYIKGNTKHKGIQLYDIDKLYENNIMHNTPEYQLKNSSIRASAIDNIIYYIESFSHDNKILHLQLRSPETGCMIHLDDLARFKRVVNKLVITCHEWEHYSRTPKSRKEQVKELDYLREADHVIFLNERDKQGALEAAAKGHLNSPVEVCAQFDGLDLRSSISNVPATVPTELAFMPELFVKRPPNVLIFGLIRPGKGFEEAIELAKAIKKLDQDSPLREARVIIAGKPHDYKLVRAIIAAKYGAESSFVANMNKYIEIKVSQFCASYSRPLQDITQQTTNAKNSPALKIPEQRKDEVKIKALLFYLRDNHDALEKLPIDIHFNIKNQELDLLANKCKFCVKLEGKCFANNSSSIINALHRGMIVFSRVGTLTSPDFLAKGEYEQALFLLGPADPGDVDFIINAMTKLQGTDEECLLRLKALRGCVSEVFSDQKIGNDHMVTYKKVLQQ